MLAHRLNSTETQSSDHGKAPPLLPDTSPEARRPLIIRAGKHLRPLVNWAAARASRVSNEPVISDADLSWTASVQGVWQQIAEEALEVLRLGDGLPRLREVSPDHASIAQDGRWRCFFLYGYGERIEANCVRMPRTAALAAEIPGLNSAFVSVLEPGAVIPPHRGVTKGLLTWHLGLSTPTNSEHCWMRVADQRLHWQQGQSILFDDTFEHEVRNDTDEPRLILLVQVERPMIYPLRALPDLFLWGIKRTAFVQEARANLQKMEEASRLLDRIEP